jgi:hypothetical protein
MTIKLEQQSIIVAVPLPIIGSPLQTQQVIVHIPEVPALKPVIPPTPPPRAPAL